MTEVFVFVCGSIAILTGFQFLTSFKFLRCQKLKSSLSGYVSLWPEALSRMTMDPKKRASCSPACDEICTSLVWRYVLSTRIESAPKEPTGGEARRGEATQGEAQWTGGGCRTSGADSAAGHPQPRHLHPQAQSPHRRTAARDTLVHGASTAEPWPMPITPEPLAYWVTAGCASQCVPQGFKKGTELEESDSAA